jgi:hypothetical protein
MLEVFNPASTWGSLPLLEVKVTVTLRPTIGQSVSKSWCQAPDIYYCTTVTVLFFVGALSEERTGLSFVYAAGLK